MKLHKGLFEILLLSMLWGPSFLFIKIAVGDIAPLTITALRTLIGVLLLYIVLKFRKVHLWKHRKLWFHCFVIGIFANGIPWICFNFAVQTIPTSLSALINGTTPVLTIILANIFLKDEQLTWGRGIGATVGLVGFCVLFLPTVFSSLQGTDLAVDMRGILLSFIGASSYAVGIVYVRKNFPSVPPLVAPVIQLFSSLLYLIPLATVTYLLPVFGTILGVTFLKETLDVQFLIAAILIFSGVLIVNSVISVPFLKRNKIAT